MGNLFDLNGKVAIVTGASRGIGKAMARRLAEHGAQVVVAARDVAACQVTAREIDALVGRSAALGVGADLADKASLQRLVDAANAHFGKVDVLVCNAAANFHAGPMATLSDQDFRRTLDVNLLANHWLAQMVAPQMAARRDGAIVIVSSVGAMRANHGSGAYSISKAADLALVRALALEWGMANVRVNAVAPGLVKTELSRGIWEDPEALARTTASYKLGRLGDPDDLAGIAVYLASAAGAWTTGQTFVVDGGALG